MKIYLLGRGYRLDQIRAALGPDAGEIVASAPDPAALRAASTAPPPSAGDLIIVTEYAEVPLRAILESLAGEKVQAKVIVFTPVPSRSLARAYPDVRFRDESLIYKNEIREFQHRVAGQQKVDAVREIAKGRPFLTLIWGNPDPDAIGSACALDALVGEHALKSSIAYMGAFTRPENAAMVEILKIPMKKFSPDMIGPDTIVATVDAQPSFFQLDGQVRFDVAIDHHPLTDPGPTRFSDVRPTYGSASSILTEYFQASGARMTKRIATALYYGLKTDTNNLTRNVSDADVAAFRYLRVRADENLVRTIELQQFPVETLDPLAVAITRKKISRDVAFAFLGTIPTADRCVPVADFFIKLAEISWVVVCCRSKDRVVVVVRSNGLRKHAGNLVEKIFSSYGTAGGHRTMARAEMEMSRLQPELGEQPSDEAIERWLLDRLATGLKPLSRFQ